MESKTATIPSADQDGQADEQGFRCQWEGCGRVFSAKFLLNRHMVIHSENKKYVCEYCQKGFTLPQYWREHVYIHTKELPYLCGVAGCTERFRQAGKLSLHRRTHPEYTLKKYNYPANQPKRANTKKKRRQPTKEEAKTPVAQPVPVSDCTNHAEPQPKSEGRGTPVLVRQRTRHTIDYDSAHEENNELSHAEDALRPSQLPCLSQMEPAKPLQQPGQNSRLVHRSAEGSGNGEGEKTTNRVLVVPFISTIPRELPRMIQTPQSNVEGIGPAIWNLPPSACTLDLFALARKFETSITGLYYHGYPHTVCGCNSEQRSCHSGLRTRKRVSGN